MWSVMVFAEDDVDEDESLDPVPSVPSPEFYVSSPPLLNDHSQWSVLSLFQSSDWTTLPRLCPHYWPTYFPPSLSFLFD